MAASDLSDKRLSASITHMDERSSGSRPQASIRCRPTSDWRGAKLCFVCVGGVGVGGDR